MCGILGEINFYKEINVNTISSASNLINHRGPDSEGSYVSKNFCIFHKRLSIIDKSIKGNNPIFNFDKNVSCTLNGMIYNYRELRDDLAKKYNFKSKTDTEVILYSYIEWGTEAFKKLQGMFSFVIHDQRSEEKIYIVRDKLGIKPMYYTNNNNKINFSSEIKPLLKFLEIKPLDSNFINEYLLFNYPISQETTLVKNIKILKPSSYLLITNNKFINRKYWEFYNNEKNSKNFHHIFNEAIKRHLISDVSIASTLSSGIDSSIITFKSNKYDDNINNYTVSFNNYEIDESKAVREFTKYHNIKTNFIKYDEESFLKDIDDTIETLEEPRVGIATQNFHLYKKISQDNHIVVLSGLGGDEMFGGYDWRYLDNKKNFDSNYFNLLIKPGYLNELLDKKIQISKKDIYQKFSIELNKIDQETPLKKCLNFEIKTFLHSLLLVEDKISMKHGIESRVPLLDDNIMEFAFNLRDVDLANQNSGKIYFSNYVNSECQIKKFNIQKKGFVIPHNQWISNNLSLINKLTNDNDIFDNYFDKKKLLKFLEDKKNDINLGQYIWKLYSLKKSLNYLEINA